MISVRPRGSLPATPAFFGHHAKAGWSYHSGRPECQAESEATKTAVEVDGRRLKATFVVSRAGRYRFKLKRDSRIEGLRAGATFQPDLGHAILGHSV